MSTELARWKMLRQKHIIIVGCIVSVALLLGCFVIIDVLGLYRYNTDVDLNSGVMRKRFYYWIVPVRQEIVPTRFSDMVDVYVTVREPKWREDVITVSISGGRTTRGGTIGSNCSALANQIHLAYETGKVTAEQREYYLKKALSLLGAEKIDAIRGMADEIACFNDD
jgi:hypothetical protein